MNLLSKTSAFSIRSTWKIWLSSQLSWHLSKSALPRLMSLNRAPVTLFVLFVVSSSVITTHTYFLQGISEASLPIILYSARLTTQLKKLTTSSVERKKKLFKLFSKGPRRSTAKIQSLSKCDSSTTLRIRIDKGWLGWTRRTAAALKVFPAELPRSQPPPQSKSMILVQRMGR